MKANTHQSGIVFRCAAALTVLLLAASPALAQQKAAGEGIKVHGHWTIDVKNADGSLASHHEFQNSLAGGGPQVLANLLTRANTVAAWGLVLSGSTTGPLIVIQEPALGYPLGHLVALDNSLTVATSGAGGIRVVLQGSVQVPSAVTFDIVESRVLPTGQPITLFSFRSLTQPIDIQPNQIVQVTVVFSFS